MPRGLASGEGNVRKVRRAWWQVLRARHRARRNQLRYGVDESQGENVVERRHQGAREAKRPGW